MMAQNDLVVVGIDVSKDKVDACIRRLALRQSCPSSAQGHRRLVAWLRKHQVNKAVMEASGGYEGDWAKALREADIEVRIVDPKRVRSFAHSAGRMAKNDAIDAEMIAWFAETFSQAPGQVHDAAQQELVALVKARIALVDLKMQLAAQSEHAASGQVQKARDRVLKSLIGEHVTIILQLDPSPRWIKADAVQLEQVLLNLAVNARDAMPNGGSLTIETGSLEVINADAVEHVGVLPGS